MEKDQPDWLLGAWLTTPPCPVCADDRRKRAILKIRSRAAGRPGLTYGQCQSCESIIVTDFVEPEYGDGSARAMTGAPLKIYVEQGAGLETLILPAFCARGRTIKRYLEVGCGFGFGLDFTSFAFDWQVKGIDPGPLAAAGRNLLGVDIDTRYLGSSDTELHAPFDAIAAVEVLEHIAQPHDFLAVLKANLARGGLAVITTPNAGFVASGRDVPGLMAALSPGYHAILFSQKSLWLSLVKAGFRDAKVWDCGASLVAVAGDNVSGIDIASAIDRDIYASYLEHRSAAAKPGSVLDIGFHYRLLKEYVNSARYPDGAVVFERLSQSIEQRDALNIRAPLSIINAIKGKWTFDTLIERFPACLPGLLFLGGIMHLNGQQNPGAASAFFYVGALVGKLFTETLAKNGHDDSEIADQTAQCGKLVGKLLDPAESWPLDVSRIP